MASIESEMGPSASTPLFQTVQTHGGNFNESEIKRIALKSPAALVAMLGGPLEREGGTQAVGAVTIVVFIATRGDSVDKRDADALALTELVSNLVVNNKWAYANTKAPERMKLTNHFHGDLDRLLVAMWSVSWTQRTDLAIFDVSTLPLFHQGNVKWDLYPKDGVIDMEDDIWVNGEFMAAYGHIYISTPVATSIAAIDTYQKAAGTTTLKTTPTAVDFDMPAVNRLRHTGTVVKPILVGADASVTVDGDAKVTLALAEDGVVDTDTEIEQEVTVTGGAEVIPLRGLFNLDEDEYVEVWVKADDTVNVTLTKLSMVAAAT